MRALLLVTAALITACASAPAVPPAPPEVPLRAIEVPPGDLRLGRDVVPSRYLVDLSVDPAQPRFSGTVVIDVDLAVPTDVVRLHADKLTITGAVARVGGAEQPLAPHFGPGGALALQARTLLPAGPATLEITFEGAIADTTEGLYRVQDAGVWYAFTQFEPLEARAAFPCFDQPDMKARFNVRLRTPPGLVALSNAPEVHGHGLGDDPGLHVFAETPPLPTYVVAFAVGPFEVREAPAGATSVPLRVITTAGKSALADLALARAPNIVTWLEKWFEAPYPYAKLDFLAVPNFAAGAMENAGLITFREEGLLVPGDAPARDRIWLEETVAHEVAHMWFGDSVTMAWWDDLWLNEAFATWLSAKVVTELMPEAEFALDAVRDRARGMGADSRASSRAIRQRIETAGDIYNAFDGITYMKGSAVLSMVEAWAGEAAFQRGVRAYIAAHKDGNAVTADLLGALAAASGLPVAEVATTFLGQPGTPLVDVAVRCDGEKAPATLTLTQTRYKQLGSEMPAGAPWQIPMCVRYGTGPKGHTAHRECFVFRGDSAQQPLSAPGCPRWIVPNADARGYYRFRVAEPMLKALAAGQRTLLSAPERVAFADELGALLKGGNLTIAEYATALQGLAADTTADVHVLETVVAGLESLRRLTGDARTPLENFARKVLAPHKAILKLKRVSTDPQVRRREMLLWRAFAEVAHDDELALRALVEAERFLGKLMGSTLAESYSLSPDEVDVYLHAAASVGPTKSPRELWQLLRDAVPKATDPVQRVAIIRALGAFPHGDLVKASLDLLLDGTLRTQDFVSLTRGFTPAPEVGEAAWSWLTENYAAMAEKLGDKIAPYLPYMGGGLCSAEDHERVRAFFAAHAESAPAGLERNLAVVLEGIDQCVRLKAAYAEPLARFLSPK